MFNIQTFRIRYLSAIILLLLFLSSCVDDHLERLINGKVKVDLDPEIGVPIGQFNITIANLLRDDSLVVQDTVNRSLKIIYRQDSLIQQDVSDVLNIPSQSPSTTTAKVGKINIADFNLQQQLLLGEVIPNLNSATRLALNLAISNGIPVPFPVVPMQNGGSYSLPGIGSFSSANFYQGSLNFSLVNNWNTTINTLVITLKNPGNQIIGKIRLFNVASGASASSTINLSGKDLFSSLSYEIDSIFIPQGTQPVSVTFSQSLAIAISGTGLIVNSAVAHIPSQNLENDTSIIQFNTTNNEEIYDILLDSGFLNLSFISTLPLQISCTLQIPGIRDVNSSNTFSQNFTIQPGPIQNISIDLRNKIIDLKLLSQGYNQLNVIFSKSLLASIGNVIVDQNDSISFTYALINLKFATVRGFFGQKDISSDPSAIDLNLSTLKDLGGSFFLANPVLELKVQNSIGVPLTLDLEMLGKKIGQASVPLNSPNRALPYPVLLGGVASGNIQYDRSNSSLPELISLPPDSILVSGMIHLNPNSVRDTNFVTKDSHIMLGVEMEMPFELSAYGIGFGDTLELDGQIFKSLKSADLIFKTINGFPFDFASSFEFMDENYAVIHRDNLQLMQSAVIDNAGVVISSTSNTTSLILNENILSSLDKAKYLAVRFNMNTPQGGKRVVKLYSDYSILLKVGVQARLLLNP